MFCSISSSSSIILLSSMPKKTQVCALRAEWSPFHSSSSAAVTLQISITWLGMEICSDLNPRNYIESVIKEIRSPNFTSGLSNASCTKHRSGLALSFVRTSGRATPNIYSIEYLLLRQIPTSRYLRYWR